MRMYGARNYHPAWSVPRRQYSRYHTWYVRSSSQIQACLSRCWPTSYCLRSSPTLQRSWVFFRNFSVKTRHPPYLKVLWHDSDIYPPQIPWLFDSLLNSAARHGSMDFNLSAMHTCDLGQVLGQSLAFHYGLSHFGTRSWMSRKSAAGGSQAEIGSRCS